MTMHSAMRNTEAAAQNGHYEICYLDGEGRLIGTYAASCSGDLQARVLAHAMRPAGTRRMEVWQGPSLIYERPERAAAANPAIGPLSPAAPLAAPI